MSKRDKWSPLRIPDAFKQYASKTDGSDDPMDSWDPSEWDDPDAAASGWRDRITPNHMGQWITLAAIAMVVVGFVMWLGKFFPLAHRNPWTLVALLWPASLLLKHVHAREKGFNAASSLDWTFITHGRTVRVIPGKIAGRFGEGDIPHIQFTPLKSRSYGAYRFKYLKLGDLNANRDQLMSKATGSNRGPDSEARILLPGALTGESSDTVLGNVFGVHGGSVEFHDSGSDTDLRVTNPSRLDDDIAADVLNQLKLYDQRIIPEMKAEIKTVETQKNRYRQRAEAERDPELDRIFGAVDTMSSLLDKRTKSTTSDGSNSDVEDINEQAREQVMGE